jgi:molybdopterin-guanine dinucleotide biosynthesis protein A
MHGGDGTVAIMPEANGDAVGIVLAGGRSTRFGSDKASALLAGRPLLDWVTAAVAEVCGRVVVVRAVGQVLPDVTAPLTVVEDEVPGEGPLAGVIAGLRGAAEEIAFVTSCDAPLLRAPLVASAVAQLARSPAAVAVVPVVEGRMQPLAAAYRREPALTAAEAASAAGERSLHRWLGRLAVTPLDEAALLAADPSFESFRNANDRATLDAIAADLAAGRLS